MSCVISGRGNLSQQRSGIGSGSFTYTNPGSLISNDWLPNSGMGLTPLLGDFNGDGKTDLLYSYSNGTGWHNYVALSNGQSGFTFTGSDWLPSGSAQYPYQVGDFNGDGYADLLYSYADGAGWHNYVALSNGANSFTFSYGDWLPGSGGIPYHLGDFNGDGKTDILFSYADGAGWHNYVALSSGTSFYWSGAYDDWLPGSGQGIPYNMGDFNGDGKTDILFAYADGAGWHNYVAFSSGSSFYFSGFYDDWLPGTGQGVTYRLGDFNGDRKTDILFAYKDGTTWHNYVAFSTGSAFNFAQAYHDWLPAGTGEGMNYYLGDFTGDWPFHRTDLILADYETDVVMQQPCWGNSYTNQSFPNFSTVSWIENAYGLLDQPGEWYLDQAAGYIYYRPRAGENLSTAKVVVPVLETLVSGSGTGGGTTTPTFLHNIQFIGLTFAFATWLSPSGQNGYADYWGGWHYPIGPLVGGIPTTATRTPGSVTFSTAQSILFQGDVFAHLGSVGLNFDTASQSNTIKGNVFSDISSTAIQVGDVTGAHTTSLVTAQRNYNNTAQDNYVTQAGAEYPSSFGIGFAYSDHANILHNEVANLPYTGIGEGFWGWASDPYPNGSYANTNHVNYNWVHDVMLLFQNGDSGVNRPGGLMSDGGGIYTESFQPSSTLTGNYIAGLGGQPGGPTRNSHAIYHDEGSRFFTDTQNVVSGAPQWLSMWTSSITNNTIQGNYVDADRALCFDQLNPTIQLYGPSANCQFGGNVVSGNTFGLPFSSPAQAIINAAGLESAFLSIKNPLCGDATCNGTETSTSCPKDCAP